MNEQHRSLHFRLPCASIPTYSEFYTQRLGGLINYVINKEEILDDILNSEEEVKHYES